MNRRYVAALFIIFSVVLLPMMSYGAAGEEVVLQPQVESTETTTADLDEAPVPRKRFLVSWLHMLDGGKQDGSEESSVLAFGPKVLGDLARVLGTAGGNKGFWGVALVLFKAVLSIALGFLFSFIIKKIFQARLNTLKHLVPPDGGGFSKFVASLLRSLPEIASLFLLFICSTLSFLAMAGDTPVEGRMLYQLILGVVLIYILFQVIGEILFAPCDKTVRLVAIDDSLIGPLHSAFSITFTVLASALLFGRCFHELGAHHQTLSWIAIVLGTVILVIMAGLVIFLRKPVSEYFIKETDGGAVSWMQQQFATYWHLPALLYVAIVWITWVGQKLAGDIGDSKSFIASVIVVPLYFVLSYFARILIEAVVASLGLGRFGAEQEESEDALEAEDVEEKNRRLAGRVYSVFRYFLVFVLFAWVCNLWGYTLPFANQAMEAIFESFVTVGLALICWRYASAYFESKMVDPVVDPDEEKKDIDDEFGGATPRGRSHTLLPVLRKVIGSTLVLMVSLIVISSLGVNIGPLLAGAGVLGLAIGFGAQKLVSDVLSGFFFLLDDAFRVGEYIQAGKVRGTVESITLRNVLLRHHLGMLQIVPHSDLGAITNYMRGGIVIKFPLEFPYDTDIDMVRKIIKKVGQAMLTDEELGEGFLQPVKSQGVNEITNSVMVIRVKFTAKPGQQFMIKREAFRRITEALNAKGIYYAHRKVIVDFPADSPHVGLDQEVRKKALEAGAAAVIMEESLAPKVEEEKQ
ncbi:MAG: small-conductance mechanosensitive channel [Desulforhopalus sp.]|jgi:small-conductance mechanosensitive channel